ncbi:MAG: hypothetical protein VB046_09755 [Paludibacter sp.]|nr:hypothetical protein [Paludibacter sp.]
MSYSITQAPGVYNLTSSLRDIVITSDEDLTIKIYFAYFYQTETPGDLLIIEEVYTPDNDGKIYIRDVGKLIRNYLYGSGFTAETHNLIFAQFKLEINGTDTDLYNILCCDAISRIEPVNFTLGNVFLHNMKPVKWIIPTSKEYKTVFLSATNSRKVEVFLTTFDGQNYTNTDKVTLTTSATDVIKTIDVSFDVIRAIFPAVDPDSIVAYRLVLPEEIAVYMIDREHYILPLQFRFLNVFNVPETIVTRGDVVRKGISTFEKSRISHVDRKFNVERSDEFAVNSGKIFSPHDYDRYAELFNSEDVEILFSGEWKKVIVTEDDSSVSLRAGSLNQKSFTFTFADPNDNNIILGESFFRWILSGGTWIDNNMWIDAGQWNDNPT